jgi:hypothetical protein
MRTGSPDAKSRPSLKKPRRPSDQATAAPSYALSSSVMSSFFMPSNACMTRPLRSASGLSSSSCTRAGTTCQETPKTVLQPAALLRGRIPALQESLPVGVDLLLVRADHLERDRLVEGEVSYRLGED